MIERSSKISEDNTVSETESVFVEKISQRTKRPRKEVSQLCNN